MNQSFIVRRTSVQVQTTIINRSIHDKRKLFRKRSQQLRTRDEVSIFSKNRPRSRKRIPRKRIPRRILLPFDPWIEKRTTSAQRSHGHRTLRRHRPILLLPSHSKYPNRIAGPKPASAPSSEPINSHLDRCNERTNEGRSGRREEQSQRRGLLTKPRLQDQNFWCQIPTQHSKARERGGPFSLPALRKKPNRGALPLLNPRKGGLLLLPCDATNTRKREGLWSTSSPQRSWRRKRFQSIKEVLCRPLSHVLGAGFH